MSIRGTWHKMHVPAMAELKKIACVMTAPESNDNAKENKQMAPVNYSSDNGSCYLKYQEQRYHAIDKFVVMVAKMI